MNVKQLREVLQQFPDDLEVKASHTLIGYAITAVQVKGFVDTQSQASYEIVNLQLEGLNGSTNL